MICYTMWPAIIRRYIVFSQIHFFICIFLIYFIIDDFINDNAGSYRNVEKFSFSSSFIIIDPAFSMRPNRT